MITIKINFKYGGWTRTLTSIFNNQWQPTKHKHNQISYINDSDPDSDRWSIVFDVDGKTFEAVMFKDKDRQRLPSVDYVIVWGEDDCGVDEELDATSIVKYS